MALSNSDLSVLKKDTERLIRMTLKYRGRKRDGSAYNDYIDRGITDHLVAINKNPRLATTGSCSGHDGYPFLSLVFKNTQVRNQFMRKTRRLGFRFLKSSAYRMTWFADSYRDLEIPEEWNVIPKRKVSRAGARHFWKAMMDLFGNFP